VKIVGLRWTPYSVPFRQPLVTSHRMWYAREGIIVEIETDTGVRGLGDVAPLADFGTAGVDECLRAIDGVASRLAGVSVVDGMFLFDAAVPDVAFAPLRCAIESACLDIEARAAGTSVAALLADAPVHAVAVNAVVAGEREAASVVAVGYRCVKLKVGAARAAEDVARVAAVRRSIGPGVALRLDANGAWSEGEAIAFLRDLAAHDIEFVEQPVASGQLDAMRRVRETTAVALAADEDVTSVGAARRVLDASAADVLIMKPAVVGGLLIGLLEGISGGYIGHGIQDVVAYIVMIVVLIFWPHGFFGLKRIERV